MHPFSRSTKNVGFGSPGKYVISRAEESADAPSRVIPRIPCTMSKARHGEIEKKERGRDFWHNGTFIRC